jgi:hypothetical protein
MRLVIVSTNPCSNNARSHDTMGVNTVKFLGIE